MQCWPHGWLHCPAEMYDLGTFHGAYMTEGAALIHSGVFFFASIRQEVTASCSFTDQQDEPRLDSPV